MNIKYDPIIGSLRTYNKPVELYGNMKIVRDYTFSALSCQVTLIGLNIDLSEIMLIAGNGKILYSFNDGIGPTNYIQGSNSVITLQNCTGLDDDTPLTIMIADSIGQSVYSVYTATNGDSINSDSPISYTYGGPNGVRDSETLVDITTGNVYKKTYTFSGSNIVSISGWVKQ